MCRRCLLVCSVCTSNCGFKHLVTINSQCMTKMVSRCLYHANHFCQITVFEENSSLNAPVSASQVNHLPSSCRWFGRSPTSLPTGLFQVGHEHKSFAVIRLGLSSFHLYILEINRWFTEKSHNWKETSSWNQWLNLNSNYLHSWNPNEGLSWNYSLNSWNFLFFFLCEFSRAYLPILAERWGGYPTWKVGISSDCETTFDPSLLDGRVEVSEAFLQIQRIVDFTWPSTERRNDLVFNLQIFEHIF